MCDNKGNNKKPSGPPFITGFYSKTANSGLKSCDDEISVNLSAPSQSPKSQAKLEPEVVSIADRSLDDPTLTPEERELHLEKKIRELSPAEEVMLPFDHIFEHGEVWQLTSPRTGLKSVDVIDTPKSGLKAVHKKFKIFRDADRKGCPRKQLVTFDEKPEIRYFYSEISRVKNNQRRGKLHYGLEGLLSRSTMEDTTEEDMAEKDTTEKDMAEKDTTEKDMAEKDTTEKDMAEKDTTEKDTAEEDTAEEDTTEEDTTEEDTTEEDTAEEDTTDEDTAEEDTNEQTTTKSLHHKRRTNSLEHQEDLTECCSVKRPRRASSEKDEMGIESLFRGNLVDGNAQNSLNDGQSEYLNETQGTHQQQETADSDTETVESVGIYHDSDLSDMPAFGAIHGNKSECLLYPDLINCEEPIDILVPKLTHKYLQPELSKDFRLHGITTIGSLAALKTSNLNPFVIQSPRVPWAISVLKEYHNNTLGTGSASKAEIGRIPNEEGQMPRVVITEDVSSQLSEIATCGQITPVETKEDTGSAKGSPRNRRNNSKKNSQDNTIAVRRSLRRLSKEVTESKSVCDVTRRHSDGQSSKAHKIKSNETHVEVTPTRCSARIRNARLARQRFQARRASNLVKCRRLIVRLKDTINSNDFFKEISPGQYIEVAKDSGKRENIKTQDSHTISEAVDIKMKEPDSTGEPSKTDDMNIEVIADKTQRNNQRIEAVVDQSLSENAHSVEENTVVNNQLHSESGTEQSHDVEHEQPEPNQNQTTQPESKLRSILLKKTVSPYLGATSYDSLTPFSNGYGKDKIAERTPNSAVPRLGNKTDVSLRHVPNILKKRRPPPVSHIEKNQLIKSAMPDHKEAMDGEHTSCEDIDNMPMPRIISVYSEKEKEQENDAVEALLKLTGQPKRPSEVPCDVACEKGIKEVIKEHLIETTEKIVDFTRVQFQNVVQASVNACPENAISITFDANVLDSATKISTSTNIGHERGVEHDVEESFTSHLAASIPTTGEEHKEKPNSDENSKDSEGSQNEELKKQDSADDDTFMLLLMKKHGIREFLTKVKNLAALHNMTAINEMIKLNKTSHCECQTDVKMSTESSTNTITHEGIDKMVGDGFVTSLDNSCNTDFITTATVATSTSTNSVKNKNTQTVRPVLICKSTQAQRSSADVETETDLVDNKTVETSTADLPNLDKEKLDTMSKMFKQIASIAMVGVKPSERDSLLKDIEQDGDK